MPSVTTQNLSVAVSQVSQPNNHSQPAQIATQSLDPHQLAQLSRAAADRQLINPKRSDQARSPQTTKRVEAAFSTQTSKAVSKQPEQPKRNPEEEPHLKEDGLMDVVA